MHQCKGTHPSSFKMPDRPPHSTSSYVPMFSRERVDVRTTYSGVTRGTILCVEDTTTAAPYHMQLV